MRYTLAGLTLGLALAFSSLAQTENRPLLISRVALNQTHVAFTYAGKIWLVGRAGGTAKRLSSSPNDETNPVFSPDGQRIAYSHNNGNDWDVFVARADGSGEPRRVTMMPEDDFVTSWTPDGKEVVFETTRDEEGLVRLYKTSVDKMALATPLPLSQSYQGSVSPNGARIAYSPRFGPGDWRYYRGGFASVLWIADLKSGAVEKISNGPHNDKSPIWREGKIYFVSDRTGIFNLFSYDTATKQTKQITRLAGQGVRTASVFGDTAAYVVDGRIHLFNLQPAGADQELSISVTPDTSELAERNAPAMLSLENILPSVNGEKLAVGARGEVLVFNTADATYKNLTNTPGVAERYPVISPDGRSVAYFSDESGEYALHVAATEGSSTVTKIRIDTQPSFYWNMTFSPDSVMVTFADRRLNLWLVNVRSGSVVRVDNSAYSDHDNWSTSFSPDSRYLAYQNRSKTRTGTIYIYDIVAKKSFAVTDGVTHTQLPVFDASGRYLYFASSANANTSEFGWGVLNGVFANPLVTRRVHALVLSKDQPWPFLPGGKPNPDAKIGEALPRTKIDFDGIQARVLNLPLPARDYAQIASGGPGRLVTVVNEWSAAPGDFGGNPRTQVVYSFDIAKGGQPQKVADVDAADITPDGGRILYRKGRDFYLVGTGGPAKPDEGKQDLGKMEVRVVPAEEWRQMFHESMRIMRDWFYDPNHHGQNLDAIERDYARYLPTMTRRGDLNSLMRQMLGYVSISHLGVSGGDTRGGAGGGSGNPIGLLGADYEIGDGRYRFKKIYRSTTYAAAGGAAMAPLDAPGVAVRDGDYLIAVNDQPVTADKNVLEYFQNLVNKPTKITVSANADGSAARAYTIYPALGENRLRRANWAEENRRKVDRLSGGKLGYIFIEDYGPNGIMNAIRGLTGYADKEGVIVDQRFNGGGITPDYLIEWMQRRPLYYYMFRGGEDIATPVNPAPPIKVMIVNELNGSAAETGAFMFKLSKVGPMVGKRTFGAGIGPYYFTPNLIDGGRVQLPNRAAYDPTGAWGVENAGVEPDYDVEIMPRDVMAGRDPQLEKAVEVAMAQVARTKPIVPKHPTYPIHPGEFEKTTGSVILPPAGSAFPITSAKPAERMTAVTNGKFAAFVGKYDAAQMGTLDIRQEGEKLFAITPNGERVELVPAAAADAFTAQPVGAGVRFERDAAGSVAAIVVMMQDGREVRGKRTNQPE